MDIIYTYVYIYIYICVYSPLPGCELACAGSAATGGSFDSFPAPSLEGEACLGLDHGPKGLLFAGEVPWHAVATGVTCAFLGRMDQILVLGSRADFASPYPSTMFLI